MIALVLGSCGGSDVSDDGVRGDRDVPATATDDERTFPPPPVVATGPLDRAVDRALDRIVAGVSNGSLDAAAVGSVASAGDTRLAWFLSDLLRFVQGTSGEEVLLAAFAELTGVDPQDDPDTAASPWRAVTDLLIAWDLPAPPGYRERKASIYLLVDDRWAPIFNDADAAIDWRLLGWGGVLADDRPLGDPEPCQRGCIPALDDPQLTNAPGGGWYPDDRIVFGVVVDGEAVAFPEHIMEVHELVNITIGQRRLGIPYCTLCGSAQAYLTDSVPAGIEPPVLRTSGLLSRSNKVMYDLLTDSAFDTFTGAAVSGPLQDEGVVLEQRTVVASTWGAWRRDHPDTRIVAEDGGIGRDYPDDPLRGRDDAGPIFPIGDVDPRLPVQAEIVGAIARDGTPVAFPVEQARAELLAGGVVSAGGLTAHLDGDGLRIRGPGGDEVAAHPARWFAWSQFHPGTALWIAFGIER
jgi:hypothetical protein